ncbi:aminotransferase class V-fold PLP-dependent enzyme [Pseudidiomarina sp.]|uniref:aminotransferase class V-fold PLP-dependent enzyme n=1 Tax=Pseudidiomarina sp. TaxID=2081707 RepID=UPI00299DD4C1|nr:aminotransferase class V-fold PLP-dependent enzyme [Pseudidiomarina sp.]MDX1706727.1 aminotransferase class V-fold PLP-dependent enzyme [Pseudidiomarina sp.]
MSYKKHYSQFIAKHPDSLHCSPHSHHYWPDVTRQAQLDYWEDSARGVDHKWDEIFGNRIPAVQQLLAKLLNYPRPEQIVFAGNTHELLYRVMSCFAPDKPLHILTTDSEFYSFSRQLRRLTERPQVKVSMIAVEPFASFEERWREALRADDYQLIFISQVFFNSALVAPTVDNWIDLVPEQTQVVVDGYHGCGAIPTDLSAVADRIFYLAGSYKYLQAGEGCCFMLVPHQCKLRPEYTGWFADFASLAKPQDGRVEYAADGLRFAGATMDYSALYRLQAVLQWWHEDNLTVAQIHRYVQQLQQDFLAIIDASKHPQLNRDTLLMADASHHGHFLTFELASAEAVSALAADLAQAGIDTDYRGNRLRFGFALYHEAADYERLKKALAAP